MPDEQALTGVAGKILDLSPDGRNLVYTANGRLYLRPLSSMIATAVQGTENLRNVASPAFSPDGQQLVFHDEEGNVKRIAVGGGGAVPICRSAPAILVDVGGRSNFLQPCRTA